MQDYYSLLEKIDYKFKQEGILQQALTHRSHSAKHNERLEFLGDAVLELVITDYLYHEYPKLPEGNLSRIRSNLVSSESLKTVASEIGLSDYLFVGKCERQRNSIVRPSILANAVEAIVAAVYLDGGLSSARSVVKILFASKLNQDLANMQTKDYKTLLQEWVQGKSMPRPEYVCVATTGAKHAQVFTMECRVEGVEYVASATGKSRQKASLLAAQDFYQYLQEQDEQE